MYVLHMKGGNMVWTYVKDNIIEDSSTTKLLDYVDLIIHYLKKMRVGGFKSYYTGIII